jgi:hypothetical protein
MVPLLTLLYQLIMYLRVKERIQLFPGCFPAVSSIAPDVSNHFSAPRKVSTSGLNGSCASTTVNPVTTHNQLHFVSEEIHTHAPLLRSRICPATENACSSDANYIHGGVNESGIPLPSNTEARFADFSGGRNNVPYSSAFARVSTNIPSNNPPNILTSINIPSQCLISAPRNMSTDTVVTIPFGNTSEIRSNMPANAINSNYVTSATAMLPIGTSYEIPPTQPRVRCTTSIANCNNTWSSEPSVQAAENVIHSSYGNQATMQSRVEMVEN